MKPIVQAAIASAAGIALFAMNVSRTIAQDQQESRCDARASALNDFIACLRLEIGGGVNTSDPKNCGRSPVDILPPVDGRRILDFGTPTAFGSTSKGTAIESTVGGLVSAPANGTVLYAGEWRSYGPVIILDAGCGTDVLIGGVNPGSVRAGDRIGQGISIGTVLMPRSDSIPVVYYEVRRNGTAVNPAR